MLKEPSGDIRFLTISRKTLIAAKVYQSRAPEFRRRPIAEQKTHLMKGIQGLYKKDCAVPAMPFIVRKPRARGIEIGSVSLETRHFGEIEAE